MFQAGRGGSRCITWARIADDHDVGSPRGVMVRANGGMPMHAPPGRDSGPGSGGCAGSPVTGIVNLCFARMAMPLCMRMQMRMRMARCQSHRRRMSGHSGCGAVHFAIPGLPVVGPDGGGPVQARSRCTERIGLGRRRYGRPRHRSRGRCRDVHVVMDRWPRPHGRRRKALQGERHGHEQHGGTQQPRIRAPTESRTGTLLGDVGIVGVHPVNCCRDGAAWRDTLADGRGPGHAATVEVTQPPTARMQTTQRSRATARRPIKTRKTSRDPAVELR